MIVTTVPRTWLVLSVLSSLPALALAQPYPSKPIRVIVAYSPGGGADVTARLVGPRLSQRLGQPVIVDNRPAASGIVGTDIVAKAIPDGHTLLLVTAAHAFTAQLSRKLPYDPIKDFIPITQVIAMPFGLMLHPLLPATTVKEFVAYAKANPGRINYGSSGPGTTAHLSTELLMSMTGMQLTHVPYKGVAQYVTAQLGGEIQFSLSNMFSTMGHWKAGRLRLIAHAGPRRLEAFPDLPTVTEAGVPGYEASLWFGYAAPARTPPSVISRLHKEITAIARVPEMRQSLIAQGNDVVANTPAEFAQIIKAEADKWGVMGKRLGVTLD